MPAYGDVEIVMREWYAIYGDDPSQNAELVIKGELNGPEFGGFRDAAKARTIRGRAVFGMYIVEPYGEQREVVIYCGPIRSALVTHAYISDRTLEFPWS